MRSAQDLGSALRASVAPHEVCFPRPATACPRQAGGVHATERPRTQTFGPRPPRRARPVGSRGRRRVAVAAAVAVAGVLGGGLADALVAATG